MEDNRQVTGNEENMSKNNIAISVQNLTKVYPLYDNPKDRLKEALHPFRKSYHHDFYALKDVSFEIKKGETVGIIGKNGAGKSTLLKIITGVLTPTSGDVQVNGKIASLLELGAGFNPEMTGMENIYLNGTIMGFTKEEMDEKVDAILSFADIGEFIDQPVKMYSSGMFARLAFSVAINVEPDILIVDEALSVGDMAFQNKCFNRMSEFVQNKKTLIFVSHSLSAVRLLCTKVIWMDHGNLIAVGKTDAITMKYDRFMQTGTIDEIDISNESISTFAKDRLKNAGDLAKDAKCYISDIKIKKNQTTTIEFSTYDNMELEILLCNLTHETVSASIGMAITRQDGLEIVRINNVRDDYNINIKNGFTLVGLKMDKINLLDGKYYLSFYLSKSNLTETFHKLENIVTFNVFTPFSKCGWKVFEGIIAMEHKWVVE